ncbi:hypothetical protein [Schaalia hyovaginalis]|uniref:Uncharacterized protein n=1 Tax=Schaalia hyovaginalis TaxID=29316 RepID=A0A923E3R2_9ACTO|nr:hypothetical protein [Schaalia hyovaginalis]MBB6335503.1 hypothetical protein [Schaalia hyovaginalis]MDY2669281.1 hypothetical protein [Schaalia hyovaginalis]
MPWPSVFARPMDEARDVVPGDDSVFLVNAWIRQEAIVGPSTSLAEMANEAVPGEPARAEDLGLKSSGARR